MQHGDGLAQPHHLLALLLHLKVKLVISLSVTVPVILHLGYEVTVHRQEVILNVPECHVFRCARVLARPVTRDCHVETRGLVLEPQLRPGLTEPGLYTSFSISKIHRLAHLRLHPAAWYRQGTRVRVPGIEPA